MFSRTLTSRFVIITGILANVLVAAEATAQLKAVRTNFARGVNSGGPVVPEEPCAVGVPDCGACDGCDGLSTCCCQPCLKWYAIGEAVFWSRNNRSANQPLVLSAPLTGNALMRTDDLDFGNQASPRFLIGHYVDCCCCEAWELSYFGINNWDTSATVTGTQLVPPGPLPFAGGAFLFASTMRADYSSNFHNVEINHVQSYCNFDFLAGFRYVSLDEEFNLTAINRALVGNYHIGTQNDLFGGQIGARVRRSSGCWGWDLTSKAGVFLNDAEQGQFINNGLNTVRPFTTSKQTGTAFVGEINFAVTRQLTDVWSLRGGYNLLWIENVALAPDQLDFVNIPGGGTVLNDNGGVFLHGASVGIQANW